MSSEGGQRECHQREDRRSVIRGKRKQRVGPKKVERRHRERQCKQGGRDSSAVQGRQGT